MKRSRVAALGLIVAVCLLAAAPAARAGVITGDGTALLERPGEWLGRWVAWLAGWIGWGGEEGQVGGGAGAVIAAHGSCVDPGGNAIPCPPGGGDGDDDAPVGPAGDGEHGSCVDPGGNRVPCSP